MDMLIRLYDPALGNRPVTAAPTALRKPLGAEHDLVVAWVAQRFGAGWASEARTALTNRPVTLYIATQGEPAVMLGFCACDATARGFVGPIGVAEQARGNGVGAALLSACLHDMRAMGYAYAVAGAVAAPEFFRRVAQATEIETSTPGVYRDMLRREIS
jgi:ribosomal protein S18 acetylase RimI-like enzyme